MSECRTDCRPPGKAGNVELTPDSEFVFPVGTKAILRELVREQRRTNALLEAAARDRAERP